MRRSRGGGRALWPRRGSCATGLVCEGAEGGGTPVCLGVIPAGGTCGQPFFSVWKGLFVWREMRHRAMSRRVFRQCRSVNLVGPESQDVRPVEDAIGILQRTWNASVTSQSGRRSHLQWIRNRGMRIRYDV